MSDNVQLNLPTVPGGQVVATDDIGGVQYQRVKITMGNDGSSLGDVSNTNPLVVDMGGASVGAFGDLIVADNFPLVQFDFVYGINSQQGTTAVTGTGAIDTNAGRLRMQTGATSGSTATFTSRRAIKYRAGQGVNARFTFVFNIAVSGTTQLVGVGNNADGYFFGYNGTTFGVMRRNAGADTWTAQASWNGDTCDGNGRSGFNINPTFGNVFQIRYPYLGYGVITFWILNPATARWIMVHSIQYPNTTATTQISNPNLSMYAYVGNGAVAQNITGYSASMAAFLTGQRSFVSNPRFAFDNNKSGITAETNIMSLRNATTYNTKVNRSAIRLNSISFGTSATNAAVTVRFRLNATFNGVASYAAINGTIADSGATITNGNSITSVDTAQTTLNTAGTLLFCLSGNGASSVLMDLTPYDIFIAPGEILTVSGFSTATALFSVSLTWSEDI